jgi:DnaK suppressor protein
LTVPPIPPKLTRMSKEAPDLVARFRPQVEAELAELLEASDTTAEARGTVALDQQSVGRVSRMDAMQGQAMAQEQERRRQGRIAALKATLKRMESGEFGECAECGEPIAERRLEVDPTALLCVACARGDAR